MKNTYSFSKKALSGRINILERYDEVGYVQFDGFKSDVTAVFKNKNYLFKKKNFWTTSYQIYRDDNKQLIGDAVFSNWKKKVEVTLINGEKYTMSTSNFWGTKWKVDDANREIMDFEQTKQFWKDEGSVNTSVNDEEKMGLLVLLGIFVNYIYIKRSTGASA